MTTKFNKVMQRLHDSLSNPCDPMRSGENRHIVTTAELTAIIMCLYQLKHASIVDGGGGQYQALDMLESCADE